MTSFDPIILKAFKLAAKPRKSGQDREKASLALKELRQKISEPEIGPVLLVHDYFMKMERLTEMGQPETPPWDAIGLLRDKGATESVGFVLAHAAGEFLKLPLDAVLTVVSSSKQIDEWCKFTKRIGADTKTHDREKVLIDRCSLSNGGDLSLVLKEWFLDQQVLKQPEACARITIATEPRKSRFRLLSHGILKDKTGKFLKACIRSGDVREEILSLLREDPEVSSAFASLAPRIIDTGIACDSWQELWSAWMKDILNCDARIMRQSMASRLVGVAGLLRLDSRSLQLERALSNAGKAGRAILENLPATTDTSGIWLPATLDSVAPDSGGDQLTSTTAEHLVLAMEKISSGSDAVASLSVCLRNLGFQPLGEEGIVIQFDSRLHEDGTGGILPGDEVMVSAHGWALGNRVMIRAKVTAFQNDTTT